MKYEVESSELETICGSENPKGHMYKDNVVGQPGAILDNILETIGQTPLIRLHRSVEHLAPSICAKVEYFNPGGSTKDRVALNMILAAERSGALKPGGTRCASKS